MKLKIFTVGKIKESWLADAMQEYTKRLEPYFAVHWELFKTEEDLEKALSSEKHPLLLDPKGSLMNSREFSQLIYAHLATFGATLSIGIGGPNGFTEEIKKGKKLLSLSPLTFTHQMTRLILLEQLYRATQIEHNTPYNR